MKTSWEITIVKESEEGFLCITSTGDTQWLSKEDYEICLENRRKRVGNISL
jgi:hypothetical protein